VECVVSLKHLLLLLLLLLTLLMTLLMMMMTCPVDLRLWTSINDTRDVVATCLPVTTPNIQHLISGGHKLRYICYTHDNMSNNLPLQNWQVEGLLIHDLLFLPISTIESRVS